MLPNGGLTRDKDLDTLGNMSNTVVYPASPRQGSKTLQSIREVMQAENKRKAPRKTKRVVPEPVGKTATQPVGKTAKKPPLTTKSGDDGVALRVRYGDEILITCMR